MITRRDGSAPRPWPALTQAERDAAYDNTAAVANSAELVAERNAASAAFRAARPAALDLRYGPRPRNCWDLFPAVDAGAPCLVFLHGGYWQRNRREDFCIVAAGVMAHGWAAALPGYTLAPEASLAEIVDEVRVALDWLAAEGPGHGICGPVVLAGWSAGGHLAAMALDHPLVAAGLAISGVFELGPLRDTYLNTALGLTVEEVETLSPLRLPPVSKPLAISYGMDELSALVRNSLALHDHRASAFAPGSLLPVWRSDHFTVLDALRRPDGALTRTALGLLA